MRTVVLSLFLLWATSQVFSEDTESKDDLTALYNAMNNYLRAHEDRWPDVPDSLYESEARFFNYWKELLAPFGAKPENWEHSKAKMKRPCYVPSNLDSQPNAARKNLEAHWFIQIYGPQEPEDYYRILPDGKLEMVKLMKRVEFVSRKSSGRFKTEGQGQSNLHRVPPGS